MNLVAQTWLNAVSKTLPPRFRDFVPYCLPFFGIELTRWNESNKSLVNNRKSLFQLQKVFQEKKSLNTAGTELAARLLKGRAHDSNSIARSARTV